jgi:hypothetical protein
VIDNTYYTPTRTLGEVIKYVEKKIPDIYELDPISIEPVKPAQTWEQSTSMVTSQNTESTAELKRRLKEKYKQMQNRAGGAAGFFSKH